MHEGWPALGWYLPAEQAAQEAGGREYLPAGQVEDVSAHKGSPPPPLKKPAGQNEQEAGGVKNVPAGHDDAGEQEEAPAVL